MKYFSILFILLAAAFMITACGNNNATGTDGDIDNIDTDTSENDTDESDLTDTELDTDGDAAESDDDNFDADSDGELDSSELESEEEIEEEWVFNREDYDPVNGWILLDNNKQAMLDSIDLAHQYGANHIQFSHGLIMYVDDLFGDPPSSNIETLNAGIEKAKGYGMKTYIWAHELPGEYLTVCYDPEDPAWEARNERYRQAFTLLPNLDGIILMYGSSGASPWYTFCSCQWCFDNYEGIALEVPPPDEKVKLVTERIGQTVVNELDKEMFVRTFVHAPNELTFHGDGLTNSRGVEFTGMHKGPVQDWQPYNPHHANIGQIGDHPSVLELDIAGEYYGMSVLPFAAPGYYRYRLNYAWQNKGIGSVMRISRGSSSALNTPNEINIKAITELIQNMEKPLENIWDEFIEDKYNLAKTDAGQNTLKQILKNTFPIRRKSHYVLGIWALAKNSDIPTNYSFDMLKDDRGYMPHWDADWTDRWNSVDKPTEETVMQIWQEGTEAVEMAYNDMQAFETLSTKLDTAIYENLYTRIQHQYYAARTWRAVKLFLWAKRAGGNQTENNILNSYMFWASSELRNVASDMEDYELESVALASPARINTFRDNVQQYITAKDPLKPEDAVFSALAISSVTDSSAELSFTVSQPAHVYLDYGSEIPDYGQLVDLGQMNAGESKSFTLDNLPEGARAVVRLRTEIEGKTYLGGDFWIFTDFKQD